MKPVLIVDDRTDIRNLITNILTTAGYEVRTAENGKIAIELYDKSPCDLVITDMFMPVMDGIELIQYLKSKYADGVKIIAMSGDSSIGLEYLEPALGLGADLAILKPFRAKEFIEKVNLLYPLPQTSRSIPANGRE